MADFTKLIEQANAAEQLPEEELTITQPAVEAAKVESLDDHRKLTETKHEPESVLSESKPAFETNPTEPWTNFTTRLKAGTKKRLHQLCLERQLSSTPPWGQQELVEEAVVAIINKYLAEA